MHSPSTGTLALTAIGTPANGRVSPGWISSAAASARSASTSTNAFSSPSSASIRSRLACTSSREDSSPPRTRAARSPAGVNMRSLEAMTWGPEPTPRSPISVPAFRISKGSPCERSPVRPRRRRRLRHRDRRARQGGRRAALSRREHRGARRERRVRAGLGPAGRRRARPGAAARRAASSGRPLRRPARGRAARAGHARAGWGFGAAVRLPGAGPAQPAGRGAVDGAAFRGPARGRRGEAAGAAVPGRQGVSIPERFLIRWRGEADPDHVKAIDAYWISAAEHGMNASTFTARVVASTGADVAAALSAAVGALSGPLHGGAPARVLKMIDAVEQAGDAEKWVKEALDKGERLM